MRAPGARRPLLLAAVLAGTAGCVQAVPDCPAPLRRMEAAELFLGRAIPGGGMVDDAAWEAFVDQEVLARFPDGFTVVEADGRWRGPADGKAVRERTMVIRVLGDDTRTGARAAEVADAYRRRFAQESVLRVAGPVCAAF